MEIETTEEIIEEIADSLKQELWTEKEFYGSSYSEHLAYSWDSFSNLVKYKIRYLFHDFEQKIDYEGISSKPFEILSEIGNYIIELDLMTIQKEKSLIFRARQHNTKESIDGCEHIGAPRHNFAGANRFSPEGIPMFYGAASADVAIKEVLNSKNTKEIVTVGSFYPAKNLSLIDLRKIPSIGIFNQEKRELIEPTWFLRGFLSKITQPLTKNGTERIEYIPSQIVTEYFRYTLPILWKRDIHGIVYKSTHNKNEDCYVLFADQQMCSDEEKEQKNTLLILKKGSLKSQKVSDPN